MDDDKQAIVVGLGTGLGGFAGFLILACVCWNIICGTWCEKKKVQPTVIPIPVKNQRRLTTASNKNQNVSTITPMKSTQIDFDYKQNLSNDLASKVKSARR